MANATIRPGTPADAEDFANLAMLTAPEYFDEIFREDAREILNRLFRNPGNLFSYTHSYFMEVDHEVAGMTLFYDYGSKCREVVTFVFLLIRYLRLNFFARLGPLLKFGAVFARIRKGDIYSSNTALYPKFRGQGLGEKLFSVSEEKARSGGFKRVVVDIKADNKKAIDLRIKLGYRIDEALPSIKIKGKRLEYVKLVKEVGMIERCLLLLVFMLSVLSCTSFAEDVSTGDASSRLEAVRRERAEVTRVYKNDLQKLNDAREAELRVIKKDFHTRRDSCLVKKAAEQKKLENDYNIRIKPLDEEEERLFEAINPGRGMNFAKSRAGKK